MPTEPVAPGGGEGQGGRRANVLVVNRKLIEIQSLLEEGQVVDGR